MDDPPTPRLPSQPLSAPEAPAARPATRVLAALGEEAAGVAHDFDNTLTAITAHATLLRQSADPETRRHGQAILLACRVGHQVVARVRRSVRPTEAPPMVRVDLEELVRDALAVAEVRADQRGIALTSVLTPAVIAGDPAELQHALMNVVHNAVDAARQAVRVELHRDAERVQIEVHDDGPGVADGLAVSIFTPWVSTRGEAGTGLGLPQALRVARAHGGDLILVTTSSAGSVFRFELPLPTGPLNAPRPLTDFEVAALEHPDEPITALVLDDDPSTREALAELLELSGFRVTSAATPARALAHLVSSPPLGLLLTDLELGPRDTTTANRPPASEGLAFIRRAAALDPTLPILVVSGASPETLPPVLSRLTAGHLVKPVSPARLVEHAQRLARVPSIHPSNDAGSRDE